MTNAALMACIAGFLHLQPAPVPLIVTLPAATIAMVKADRGHPGALYAAGVIYVPPNVSVGLLAHELTHALQEANGYAPNTPAAEREAEYVQLYAKVWCHEESQR